MRYLQLAHNQWDVERQQARAQVIYSFGREDQLDRVAIERLVRSLSRVLEPAQQLAVTAGTELSYVDSRRMGAAWVFDQVWRRVGIDRVLCAALSATRMDDRVERVIFAMVANRALEPLSKLAATRWVAERVAISGLHEMSDDECYRAMDWLLGVEDEIAEAVYWQVADLLNLEVDLLFFDTSSTYFETDTADEVAAADGVKLAGFRSRGHSKDHRPDLPQVVIGMAVTRTGIPIRVWCWPGYQNDSELIRQVKDDLKAWKLVRVVWVADRGFASAENRRYLQRAGGHYILGEKMRGNNEAEAALARPGRYRQVAHNLRVKEVVLDNATMRDRFVICHNPIEGERDKATRERLVIQLTAAISESDSLDPTKRIALAAALPAGLRRYLRTTAGGRLRIDKAAIADDAKLDGKFLLRTSDPTLSTEDVALGYKQLLEVERGWRDMKTTLDLRPVYHRLEDRIRAHVLLCWLSLLLIRIIENQTDDTWRNVRHELDRMHLGIFTGPAGTAHHRTTTTPGQHRILNALNLPEPPLLTRLSVPVTPPGA